MESAEQKQTDPPDWFREVYQQLGRHERRRDHNNRKRIADMVDRAHQSGIRIGRSWGPLRFHPAEWFTFGMIAGAVFVALVALICRSIF